MPGTNGYPGYRGGHSGAHGYPQPEPGSYPYSRGPQKPDYDRPPGRDHYDDRGAHKSDQRGHLDPYSDGRPPPRDQKYDDRYPDYTHNGRPDDSYRGYDDPYNRYGTAQEVFKPGRSADPYGQDRHEDPHYSTVNKNGARAGSSRNHDDGYHPGPQGPYSEYEMDHLATFTVGNKQGLMSPKDGIRKLRQMELSTGIWTMRVALKVEPREIVIIDKSGGDEMERFPCSLVNEPTAVTNEDRRDVYNNIVLFTVLEDPYRMAPSEMHLFQCIGKPAHEVVEDIRNAKSGKKKKVPTATLR